MKTEMQQKILEWKSEKEIIGTRQTFKLKTSIKENEYLLKIVQTVKVSFKDKSKTVSAYKYFQTEAQNDSSLNPSGDLIKFERVKRNLENDFENKYQNAIDELLEDKTEETFN